MAYTPNPEWASDTVISTTALDNLETQYSESSSYLSSHNHDSDYYQQSAMDSTYWHAGNDGSGSGADADLLYRAEGNLHGSSFSGLGIDSGIIIFWYGAVGDIPAGWVLCDGTDGTPDLRGKFVVGAGNSYNPATTGGSATFSAAGTITIDAHILTIAEMASHTHPYTDRSPAHGLSGGNFHSYNDCVGSDYYYTGTTSAAGSGSGHGHSTAEGTAMNGSGVASLPYYYALCYIMKT